MIKEIKSFLVIDYNNGKVRTMKRIGKLKPTELPIHLNISINVPEVTTMNADIKINLGKKEITELMFPDEEGNKEQ